MFVIFLFLRLPMFRISRIQLAILACIPFLLTLTIISMRGSWTRTEIVRVTDPTCNVWEEDDKTPRFTLFYLPSDSQAKFLGLSMKLHKEKPQQQWDAVQFSSVRGMVPVNDVHWGNILTLVMDFNDYLSHRDPRAQNLLTHFTNVPVRTCFLSSHLHCINLVTERCNN